MYEIGLSMSAIVIQREKFNRLIVISLIEV